MRTGLPFWRDAWRSTAPVIAVWCATSGCLTLLLPSWPEWGLSPVLGFVLAFGLLSLSLVTAVFASFLIGSTTSLRLLWLLAGLCLMASSSVDDLSLGVVALLRGLGLLMVGSAAGTWLGREIQEPRYLWPLVLVALSMDAWSVLSAMGPTQLMVVEGQAPLVLSYLLVALPVPGVGVEGVLGVADIIFAGMMVGATHHESLSTLRALSALFLALLTCLAALVIVQMPIPALVFIGPFCALAHGAKARPDWKEVVGAITFAGVLVGLARLAAG